MPLLLDLLPLGHTLEEDDYATTVCYEGGTQPSAEIGGGALAGALLLAGLVHVLPAMAGDVNQPSVGGSLAYPPTVVTGFVYPRAAVFGETFPGPTVMAGEPDTVLLLGEPLPGVVGVAGSAIVVLLTGFVHEQPTVTGRVLARCE